MHFENVLNLISLNLQKQTEVLPVLENIDQLSNLFCFGDELKLLCWKVRQHRCRIISKPPFMR